MIRVDLPTVGSLSDAEKQLRDTAALAKQFPFIVGTRVLFDLRGVDIGSHVAYREIYSECAKIFKPKRVAMFAGNQFLWVLANFIFSASGMLQTQQKVKAFTLGEKALEWLKKDE